MESYLSFILNSLIFFPLSFLRHIRTRQRWAIYHRLYFIIYPSAKTSLNFWKRSLYSSRYFLQYSKKFIVSSISTPNLDKVCFKLSSSMSHSLVYSMVPSSFFEPIASQRQKPYLLPQGVLKLVVQNLIEKCLLPQTLLPSSICLPFSSIFLRIVQLSGIVAMKTPPTRRLERIAASPFVRAFSELNMQWKQSCAETISQYECCISQQKD